MTRLLLGKAREKEKIIETSIVCALCGSDQIEQRKWVDVNTDETLDSCGDDSQDNWCRNCEEHDKFVTKEQYDEATK